MTDPGNPYAAPAAQVEDVLSDPTEPATRMQRLRAAVIDTVFIGLASGIANLLDKGIGGVAGPVLSAVPWVALAATNLLWLKQDGQTIGKRVVSIRILRVDGTPAGLLRILFLRMAPPWVLSVAAFWQPLFGLAPLVDALFIFGGARRCIHDYVADTIVVKTAPAA